MRHLQDLRRSNFTAADIRRANFSHAKLNAAYMMKVVAYQTDFTASVWQGFHPVLDIRRIVKPSIARLMHHASNSG
jgi:hypothetical protein